MNEESILNQKFDGAPIFLLIKYFLLKKKLEKISHKGKDYKSINL